MKINKRAQTQAVQARLLATPLKAGLDSKRTIGVRLFVRDSMRRGRAGVY